MGVLKRLLRDRLIYHGNRYNIPPSYSSEVVDHLLREAFVVATQKESRELTLARFLEIFEEKTTQRVPIQHLRYMQIPSTIMDTVVGLTLIGSQSDVTIQSHSSIQTNIPPLYSNFAPRTDLTTSIQSKLQSEGLAVIQGGTGIGKTTLAKLTANTISGSWFWLNFTKKDSSQVIQLLQQLSIEVSNQSSPINIVLDDLNLQPQQLRQYEEALGTVVYRVLEYGAKLLITSQHDLPNDVIRRLGVSPSVVIHIPNFTIHEIEQFAQQLGCPTDHAKTWAKLIRLHTSGHPRLVHARLTQLQMKDWRGDENESIFQTPQEVVEEREEARQLLVDLSEDQRELLYRLSLISIEFRRDCALNIGEIPESIPHPGDTFSQLVGPWIDPSRETYYTISPLLDNAAKQVWSESKINDLHAQIANAILKAKNLTITEAWSVLLHSIFGKNKESLIAVVQGLLATPKDNWKKLSQEFSWLTRIKTDPPEELFPEDVPVNHLFRLLQYRIAIEVEPDFALKILKIWDKETKPYEPHNSYLMSRINLATQALLYHQMSLPVKKKIDYLKEIIDSEDSCKEIQEYNIFKRQLEKHITDKSNFFSALFSLIWVRRPTYAPFLNDLIDALDELQSKIRTLLLIDFKNDTTCSQFLIDNIWLSEATLENPDWTRCLQVYDKVIERTIVWGYPHIASAAARGKAIIQDEYLHDPDAACKSLQDILLKVEPSSVIEDEQAVIFLRQKRYSEALNIYERILPEWSLSSEKLDLGPSNGYRRAAICAAHLDDWGKAATFFEEGAKRAQEVNGTEQYIGLYADAGFAQFKAGNILNSMRLLTLALQKFDMLPQDDRNVRYLNLKKLLVSSTAWLAQQKKKNNIEFVEPLPGFCSNPDRYDEIMTFPNFPIQYAWTHLSQMEYQFNLGMTIFGQVRHVEDRNLYPSLDLYISLLETQYDYKNKVFDDLPQRIYQLAKVNSSMEKHRQSRKGIEEKGVYSISVSDLSNCASIENIVNILVPALLIQLSKDIDINKILSTWRTGFLELPIKENMNIALDLIESMLSRDGREASIVMRTQESKPEEQLVAALKIIHNIDTDPRNLFYAHTLVATVIIDKDELWGWEEYIMTDLADLFSRQWLEKVKFRAMLKMPTITVPQIERACNNSEAGKKKVGQILLEVRQAVSVRVSSEILQQLRSWVE